MPHTPFTVLPALVTVTYVPRFVTLLFRGMPGMWTGRHRLILGWLIVMQALLPGRKTLEELARWTPASITVGRVRRVRQAASWEVHVRVAWWVEAALQTVPPAKDGPLYLVGDGSVQPKRGTQHPVAHKGRKSEHQPWCFGRRLALLVVTWDGYRLPVALRLIRVKTPPEYQTDNALCREMVSRCVPPPGPSASWSRATRPLVPTSRCRGSCNATRTILLVGGAWCSPLPGRGKRSRTRPLKTW
jgi:hypothetical protein